MPVPTAFKKNAKPKEESEVREGESNKEQKAPPFAKKGKKKGKKEEMDTEIEKGGRANEGVSKMNDPRKKGKPALDDENNDSGSKKMDKKGKNCGCDHKNDALTPQEYLAACEGGFQDQSRSYIRARLDVSGGGQKKAQSSSESGPRLKDLQGYGAKKEAARQQFANTAGSTKGVEQRMKGDKKSKPDSVWADGFGKFDAATALSANAMNLATDKYKREKRKRNAQSQPRNTIFANTFNT